MDNNLNGKVCVVTGAAKSIGLAISEKFCQDGAKVAMIDIDKDVINQAERISSKGSIAKGYVVDITNQQDVFDCFEKIEKELGSVYVLINNAGIVDQCPIEEATPKQIDKIMQVNVNGIIYCCQAVSKMMKENKSGRIVNFSSKSGKTGSAIMVPYSASKGAVIALTHALAFEWAPYKINVNCICPGIIDESGVWSSVSKGYVENLKMSREEVIDKFTAKIPLKRLAKKEDIVETVYFLVTKGDYFTGQAINITGGREVH